MVKQLEAYTIEIFHNREKVIYLNKLGRDMIGSTEEARKGFVEHTLLRNEVYLHYRCPVDWKNEYVFEVIPPSSPNLGGINISGSNYNLANRMRVISDAAFKRNGYLYLVEVDNERKMIDNKKKIETYKEMLKNWKGEPVILCFFTKTNYRKDQLSSLLHGVRTEIKTFDEIK